MSVVTIKDWKDWKQNKSKEVNDWKKHEEKVREYLLLDLATKITRETNENYTMECTWSSEDFYLKTSFLVPKEALSER